MTLPQLHHDNILHSALPDPQSRSSGLGCEYKPLSRLELKSLTSDERKYEDQNRIQLRIHLHLSLQFTPEDCS